MTELSIKCVIALGNSTGFDYLAARIMVLNFKMPCKKVIFFKCFLDFCQAVNVDIFPV